MKKLRTVFFTLLMLVFALSTNAYAASNDVLRVPISFDAVKDDPTDEELAKNRYDIFVDLENMLKLKKGITISAKIIIPSSIFKSEEDEFRILPHLEVVDKKGNYLCGFSSKYGFCLAKEGNAPVLAKQFTNRSKFRGAGIYGSVKKSGTKYYVVEIKNIPLLDLAASDGKTKLSKLISGGKKYQLGVSFVIEGAFSKKVRGQSVYVDDIKLTASKTQFVDFSKASAYRALHANRESNDVSVRIAKLTY